MKRLIFVILLAVAGWLVVARLRRSDSDGAMQQIAEEARLTLAHFNRG